MKLLTKVSGALAVVGAAALVTGLSLSPGVGASFSDQATARAGVSVASSLDCDDPNGGIGCPKQSTTESLLAAEGTTDDGGIDDPTVMFGIAKGATLPYDEPDLTALPAGDTLTVALVTESGHAAGTVIGSVHKDTADASLVWSVPDPWDLTADTWAAITRYAETNGLVVADASITAAPSPTG